MVGRQDIFARVGGDEFVVLMAVADSESARNIAVGLHLAMNNIPYERRTVVCSVGELIVSPGNMLTDDLLRGADNLMYEAKRRGAGLQVGHALAVVSRQLHQVG
jgi:diguanylate cyclase (GGDEF)-like protein